MGFFRRDLPWGGDVDPTTPWDGRKIDSDAASLSVAAIEDYAAGRPLDRVATLALLSIAESLVALSGK